MLRALAIFLLSFQSLVLLYFIILNATYTLFNFVSLFDIRRYLSTGGDQNVKSILSGSFYRPLSIIVPAYNEEETIVPSLKSLLALNYPEFEVIVVNDGSKDSTLKRLQEEFRLVSIDRPLAIKLKHQPIEGVYVSLDYPNMLVLDKKNGGKADALNAGINAMRFPLMCCIDADSLLDNDSLLKVVRPFIENREVIATGGVIRVLNGCRVEKGNVAEVKAPKRAIELFQAVEYIRGFLLGRTAWSSLGSLLIISGAFSIFRKDMLIAVGGYRDTVGEDMDLVLRLHKHCRDNHIRHKIVFVPDPVCWTQVPSDYASLLKQRNRWQRGLIESLWFNRGMFLNPKYGVVGLFAYPYFICIEALGPVAEFIGYLGFILFYVFGYVSRDFALLFFAVAMLWGQWINLGAILLDGLIYKRYQKLNDVLKLCLFGLLEFFGPRQLIVMERLIAVFQIRSKGWDKLARHAIEGDRDERITKVA